MTVDQIKASYPAIMTPPDRCINPATNRLRGFLSAGSSTQCNMQMLLMLSRSHGLLLFLLLRQLSGLPHPIVAAHTTGEELDGFVDLLDQFIVKVGDLLEFVDA